MSFASGLFPPCKPAARFGFLEHKSDCRCPAQNLKCLPRTSPVCSSLWPGRSWAGRRVCHSLVHLHFPPSDPTRVYAFPGRSNFYLHACFFFFFPLNSFPYPNQPLPGKFWSYFKSNQDSTSPQCFCRPLSSRGFSLQLAPLRVGFTERSLNACLVDTDCAGFGEPSDEQDPALSS